MYIYQLHNWPKFNWDEDKIAESLRDLRSKQNQLINKMRQIGFDNRERISLDILTSDILRSSEIEGEILNPEQVRSSLARNLGINIGALKSPDRNVEGIVQIILDATQNYDAILTEERLFNWHAALFPTGRSGMSKITVANWRMPENDPMQVVSGAIGKQKVHYEAVSASLVPKEMNKFINWFNDETNFDAILKSAIAHLWFVTIHPFDDGNGRIARALADMMLAKDEKSKQRFYSMSSQIGLERNDYYDILEDTQKGSLNITLWLEWFISCMSRAIDSSHLVFQSTFKEAKFWEYVKHFELNERQRKVLGLLLDGFEGKLTSSKYAKLTKCSNDTALRDIEYLIEKNILKRNAEGGRSTSYSFVSQVFQ